MSCRKIVNAISLNQHHCSYHTNHSFSDCIVSRYLQVHDLVSASNKIVTDICAKQIGSGVVVFFALVGFFGFLLNCSTGPSSNNRRPRMARSSNHVPDSREDGSVLVVLVVIIFAILGIVYAFVAATIAVQRILQRHYHILVKKELTKVNLLRSLICAQHLF